MGLVALVKDIFTKTEVTEETFEYESIDSYLAKQEKQKENGPSDDVAYLCDQIVDATYQMEDLKVEYDMVTSYFTDIQLIEELPADVKREMIDIAKKIAFLESETSQFLHSDDRISDENFRLIQGLEKELTDIFGQLKELEDMDLKIKRDMKHLESEKNTQEYYQEAIENRQGKLRIFMLVFGMISALAVVTLALAGLLADANLIIPILIILLVVAGMAALCVVTYRNLSYEYKMSGLRENKAINLMNKVKIKFINNTATLDYLYSKYNVKSLRELEYLYDQYLIMVDEVRQYQRSAGNLRDYSDALTKLLFAHGVKDPDIWAKQSMALVDSREMVEVKHSLNVRRQKLREQITYNEELRLNGLKSVQALLKANPELKAQVRQELELYHINL